MVSFKDPTNSANNALSYNSRKIVKKKEKKPSKIKPIYFETDSKRPTDQFESPDLTLPNLT